MPFSVQIRCIEPPLPLVQPVALPNSSATISFRSPPLARYSACPRYVPNTTSSGRRAWQRPTGPASCPMERWTGLLIRSVGYALVTSSSTRRIRYNARKNRSCMGQLLFAFALQIPGIGLRESVLEACLGSPAEAVQLARVQCLARHAVGLARIEPHPARITDRLTHAFRQLANRHVHAGAEVNRLGPVVTLPYPPARVGQLADENELTPRRPRAPTLHPPPTPFFRP